MAGGLGFAILHAVFAVLEMLVNNIHGDRTDDPSATVYTESTVYNR